MVFQPGCDPQFRNYFRSLGEPRNVRRSDHERRVRRRNWGRETIKNVGIKTGAVAETGGLRNRKLDERIQSKNRFEIWIACCDQQSAGFSLNGQVGVRHIIECKCVTAGSQHCADAAALELRQIERFRKAFSGSQLSTSTDALTAGTA